MYSLMLTYHICMWNLSIDIIMLTYHICICNISFCMFFFTTTDDYSITQTWSGLGNQTEIEQPIKQSSLWKDLAVLAKES